MRSLICFLPLRRMRSLICLLPLQRMRSLICLLHLRGMRSLPIFCWAAGTERPGTGSLISTKQVNKASHVFRMFVCVLRYISEDLHTIGKPTRWALTCSECEQANALASPMVCKSSHMCLNSVLCMHQCCAHMASIRNGTVSYGA
jgi:hypothetical protein